MTFGEKIRYVRKKLMLTQAEIGKELSVTEQTIRRWEHDLSQPHDPAKRKFFAFCSKKKINLEKEDIV
jgi:DNA-binding transcriptional regulator YiaG